MTDAVFLDFANLVEHLSEDGFNHFTLDDENISFWPVIEQSDEGRKPGMLVIESSESSPSSLTVTYRPMGGEEIKAEFYNDYPVRSQDRLNLRDILRLFRNGVVSAIPLV